MVISCAASNTIVESEFLQHIQTHGLYSIRAHSVNGLSANVSLAVVSVSGVTEAFEPDREGESFTRTLMKFENGQTATLEMGGYPGAVYGPSPWSHRVLGTKGEIRVVGSDVVLYNEDHLDG